MVDARRVRSAVMEHRAMLGGPTVVYLNPGDVEELTEQDRDVITAGGRITIRADRTVLPGGYSVGKGA